MPFKKQSSLLNLFTGFEKRREKSLVKDLSKILKDCPLEDLPEINQTVNP